MLCRQGPFVSIEGQRGIAIQIGGRPPSDTSTHLTAPHARISGSVEGIGSEAPEVLEKEMRAKLLLFLAFLLPPPAAAATLEAHPLVEASAAAETCLGHHVTILEQIRLARIIAPEIGRPVSSLEVADALARAHRSQTAACTEPTMQRAVSTFKSRLQPHLANALGGDSPAASGVQDPGPGGDRARPSPIEIPRATRFGTESRGDEGTRFLGLDRPIRDDRARRGCDDTSDRHA